MKYDLLSKYYYKGPEKYKEEYKKRFESMSSLKLNFNLHSHDIFIVTTPDMVKLLSEIYKKNAELIRKRNKLPVAASQSYQRSCLVDEVMLTNDIEGVYSTRKEITDVLAAPATEDKSKRFKGLVIKYSLLQKQLHIPLTSCQDIRTLYEEIVLNEVKEENSSNIPDGEIFRKEPAQVISATQQEKHTGLFPESKIIDAMNQALAIFNNQEVAPLLRISIFHYLFGYIHPFYDGNGRTSRFISSYALSRELDPLVAYRLSFAIKEKKQDYYKAFDACNDEKNRGDLTSFVILFLEMIEGAVDNLLTKLADGLQRLEFYNNLLKRAFPSSKEALSRNLFCYLIQNALFSHDRPGRKELQDVLTVSYPTVKAALDSLLAEGAPIRESREGRNKIAYVLDLDEVGGYLQQRTALADQDTAILL